MKKFWLQMRERLDGPVQLNKQPEVVTTSLDAHPMTMTNGQNGSTGGRKITPDIAVEPTITVIDSKPQQLPRNKSETGRPLALYEDDTTHFSINDYLRSFKGGEGDATDEPPPKQSLKLGTLLGVYLPSIQNVLGIQMFLRLLWIVGMAGIVESFTIVAICCVCTFLTSISIAAVATNGLIEGGGPYYMISRNLGPEFGGAIGILYFLANAAAAAMYMSGGVELLLMYMDPYLPHVGHPENYNVLDMLNNFRIYATIFLVIECLICCVGLKYVQVVGPLSLACVILSLMSVYAGVAAATSKDSPMICLLGNRLLRPSLYMDANGTAHCNKAVYGSIWKHFCPLQQNVSRYVCDEYFQKHRVEYVAGIPGFSTDLLKENLWSTYSGAGESSPGISGDARVEVIQDFQTSFFVLMAILFPSFTDFICGANLSGYLKDPQKSLGIGVVGAQISTSLIYLTLVLVYGASVRGPLLRDKYGRGIGELLVVSELAWPHVWVLLVGCFTSTFGAALQCLSCAPRIIHAIAQDGLIPFLSFLRPVTKRNEPLRALFMTVLVAELCILLGSIDQIAPVVNCLFLMCYGAVNVACALQTLLKAPNWRPRFKFYHWSLSVTGALLCMFIMITSSWYYAIVVIALCAGLYKYIEYKGAKQEWGDGISGLALSTAQYSLLKVEGNLADPKNWRPQILVMVKSGEAEEVYNRKLLQFASQLKAGRGLTMIGCLLNGDLSNPPDLIKAQQIKEQIKEMIKEIPLKAFVEVILGKTPNVGAMLQCVGIGALRPNTVMVGWPYNWKARMRNKDKAYWQFLDGIHRTGTKNMCLLVPKGLSMFPEPGDQLGGTIDVWWIMHDGGLMILLPFLLTQHRIWRNCRLRIFTIAHRDDNSTKLKEELQKWVYQLRIQAQVDVVEMDDTDIALATYERTLKMEDRARLSLSMSVSNTRLDELNPQLLYLRHSHANLEHAMGLHSPFDPEYSTEELGESGISTEEKEKPTRRTSTSGDKRRRSSVISASKEPTVDEHKELPSVKSRRQTNLRWSLSPSSDDDDMMDDDYDLGHADGERSTNDDTSDDESSFVDQQSERPSSTQHHVLKPSKQRRSAEQHERFKRLDSKMVKKMHTAVKLNKHILAHSGSSRLVILNLPRPPTARRAMMYYLEYLDALTEDLRRVLLVRGSGKEVITIHG